MAPWLKALLAECDQNTTFPGAEKSLFTQDLGVFQFVRLFSGSTIIITGLGERLPKSPYHENVLESASRTSSELGSPEESERQLAILCALRCCSERELEGYGGG